MPLGSWFLWWKHQRCCRVRSTALLLYLHFLTMAKIKAKGVSASRERRIRGLQRQVMGAEALSQRITALRRSVQCPLASRQQVSPPRSVSWVVGTGRCWGILWSPLSEETPRGELCICQTPFPFLDSSSVTFLSHSGQMWAAWALLPLVVMLTGRQGYAPHCQSLTSCLLDLSSREIWDRGLLEKSYALLPSSPSPHLCQTVIPGPLPTRNQVTGCPTTLVNSASLLRAHNLRPLRLCPHLWPLVLLLIPF